MQDNPEVFKFHYAFLIVFCIFLISLSLTVDFIQAINGFVGDLAVYVSMGQSLAFDFDCEYTREDLVRIQKDWGIGPMGVFLKKVGTKIYFAKPVLYPLCAAPFVRLFEVNGFLLFNALTVIVMVLCGIIYLRCYNRPAIAILFSSTFFLFNVGFSYSFTIAPESFNMCLVTLGYFFWFFPREKWDETFGQRFRWFRPLLTSPWSTVLSVFFIGLATFSKLTNAILFIGPMLDLVYQFYCHRKEGVGLKTNLLRKGAIATLSLTVFLVIVSGLFGVQKILTGEVNPQGGDRKVFYYPDWPFYDSGNTFENGGIPISPERTVDVGAEASFPERIWGFFYQRAQYTDPTMIAADIYYFFFGRFGGLLPYFPLAFAGFILVFWQRSPRQWILFSVAVTTITIFLLVMPQNYVGGAAIGNRYFINTYPIFLFVFTRVRGKTLFLYAWIVGSLFLSPLIMNPYQTHYQIGNFGTSFPYRLLPLEQSLIANYPTNVDNKIHYVPFSADPSRRYNGMDVKAGFHVTFADHNSYGYEWAMEREGFWVKGEATSQFVIRYPGPRFSLTMTVQNGAEPNRITIRVAGCKTIKTSFEPGEKRDYQFDEPFFFPYFGQSLVKCSVSTSTGFIPFFHDANSPDDKRYLGCYVSLKTDNQSD